MLIKTLSGRAKHTVRIYSWRKIGTRSHSIKFSESRFPRLRNIGVRDFFCCLLCSLPFLRSNALNRYKNPAWLVMAWQTMGKSVGISLPLSHFIPTRMHASQPKGRLVMALANYRELCLRR